MIKDMEKGKCCIQMGRPKRDFGKEIKHGLYLRRFSINEVEKIHIFSQKRDCLTNVCK